MSERVRYFLHKLSVGGTEVHQHGLIRALQTDLRMRGVESPLWLTHAAHLVASRVADVRKEPRPWSFFSEPFQEVSATSWLSEAQQLSEEESLALELCYIERVGSRTPLSRANYIL